CEGDRFMVVLPNAGFIAAVQCGERLRKTVEKVGQQLAPRLNSLRITVSIGVTSLQGGAETFDDLMVQADRALQMAKEGGRNTVVGHAPRYLAQGSRRSNAAAKGFPTCDSKSHPSTQHQGEELRPSSW
ncbi:MAG: GGDEF domain-containing protein, partial [Magnetococcus sp. DMHC-1]